MMLSFNFCMVRVFCPLNWSMDKPLTLGIPNTLEDDGDADITIRLESISNMAMLPLE
jgi:hypothetical protein